MASELKEKMRLRAEEIKKKVKADRAEKQLRCGERPNETAAASASGSATVPSPSPSPAPVSAGTKTSSAQHAEDEGESDETTDGTDSFYLAIAREERESQKK
jgi:hypothetical protein